MTPARSHARGAAWAVLLGAGSTMVTFNIWHALHTGGLRLLLAVMVGLAPAGLAVGLSHIVAAHNGGNVMRGIAFLVMAGAMVLSVSATGDVVHPAVGPLWWLFGAVVDSAALVALQVILTPATAPAAEPRPAPAVAVPEPAGPPAAARPAPPKKRAAAARRKPAPRSAARVPQDVDAQAEALAILAADPGISGAELGRRAGRSERWGQDLKKKLAAVTPVAAGMNGHAPEGGPDHDG